MSGAPQAMLIKPDDSWPLDQWDENAQALHGVAYDELVASGAEAGEVCEMLNSVLAGRTVYSDAPDWDGFWFYRLFQAGGIRQAFSVRDFFDVFRTMAPEVIDEIVDEANRTAPRAHRAIPDVLHMRALYELAAQRD